MFSQLHGDFRTKYYPLCAPTSPAEPKFIRLHLAFVHFNGRHFAKLADSAYPPQNEPSRGSWEIVMRSCLGTKFQPLCTPSQTRIFPGSRLLGNVLILSVSTEFYAASQCAFSLARHLLKGVPDVNMPARDFDTSSRSCSVYLSPGTFAILGLPRAMAFALHCLRHR